MDPELYRLSQLFISLHLLAELLAAAAAAATAVREDRDNIPKITASRYLLSFPMTFSSLLGSIEVGNFSPAINHASRVLLYFNVLLTGHWHIAPSGNWAILMEVECFVFEVFRVALLVTFIELKFGSRM